MQNNYQDSQAKTKYDVSEIRPRMRMEEIKLRWQGMPPARLEAIKKGLLALHSLEIMAVNIYRYQITKLPSEHNRSLITAMCNEMTHVQDYQVKLFEFGFKPSRLRWFNWLVGFAMGAGSRLLGRKMVLKTGVWVETKAVHHYGQLLKDIDWDEDTRKIIEKDQADEFEHIHQWKTLLGVS